MVFVLTALGAVPFGAYIAAGIAYEIGDVYLAGFGFVLGGVLGLVVAVVASVRSRYWNL